MFHRWAACPLRTAWPSAPTFPQSLWLSVVAEGILAFFLLALSFSPALTTSLVSFLQVGQYLAKRKKEREKKSISCSVFWYLKSWAFLSQSCKSKLHSGFFLLFSIRCRNKEKTDKWNMQQIKLETFKLKKVLHPLFISDLLLEAADKTLRILTKLIIVFCLPLGYNVSKWMNSVFL